LREVEGVKGAIKDGCYKRLGETRELVEAIKGFLRERLT